MENGMKVAIKRRWKILHMDPQLITMSLMEGSEVKIVKGLPEDTETIACHYDPTKRMLIFTLESKEFPLSHELTLIEPMDIQITRLEVFKGLPDLKNKKEN